MRDELAAELLLPHIDELQHVARDPGLPERLGDEGAAPRGDGRRLEDDGRASGEGGQRRSRRDGDREVPGRGDQRDRGGHEPGARDLVELGRQLGVVVREVDGLGHLGVGLIDGLAAFGHHDLDQVCPTRFEDVPHPVQHPAALGSGLGTPR